MTNSKHFTHFTYLFNSCFSIYQFFHSSSPLHNIFIPFINGFIQILTNHQFWLFTPAISTNDIIKTII